MLQALRNFAPVNRYDVYDIMLSLTVYAILIGMAVFHISLFFVGVSFVALVIALMLVMQQVNDLMGPYVVFRMDSEWFAAQPDDPHAKHACECSTLVWELESRRASPIALKFQQWLVMDQGGN